MAATTKNVSKKVSPDVNTKTTSSKKKEKIIITAALPYANGQIHIGHLLEYVQADIYTRFLKLIGKDVLYICASDMHGTPIEVNAKKEGKDPEKFATEFWTEHQKDFASFLIHFDNYYKTHSPENKELAEFFFAELKKKKLIIRKKINVIYCPHCERSLPDRYVKGICPHCTTANQYGDVCESCSSVLKGTDLIDPKCSICGKTPIQKESEHYFFQLSKFGDRLKAWANAAESSLQPEVRNWLKEWFDKGLEDWCISRDAPYFGFEIPESEEETGEKKYFYVWMDAPIGYISSTQNYCDKHKLNWKDYWYKGEVQHFIGKDIAYFHFLFWPAMLMALDFPLPQITVHGFITVNGEKMSKSRGTFFTAKDFIKMYPAEALRFFYANHLDRKVIDVDLNFEDFIALNNNVLMGSLGNFCYRVLTFAQKNYGEVKEIAGDAGNVGDITRNSQVESMIEAVQKYYSLQDFKAASKEILKIADIGNSYFQQAEPWKSKDDAKARAVVGWCVNLARNLSIVTSPILPEFAGKVQHTLGEKNLLWENIDFKWKGKLHEVPLLVQKLEKVPDAVQFLLHMVVGQIKEVKDHPNADSLYLLKVDFGSEIGLRQVVAGLKKYFTKDLLLNRKAVFCCNLKPATIRGEKSEAMILVADDMESVSLLEVGKTEVGGEVTVEGTENSYSEITFDDFKKLILMVSNGKVWYEKKRLVSKVQDVQVHGVKEGARIM